MAEKQQWNDVFFRATKNDTGMYPLGGSPSACFDIVPRQEPLEDPSKLIKEDWDKNDCQNLNARMTNYIYVRAGNAAEKSQTGHVHLYYCRANLLLYPVIWKNNVIKVGSNKECFDFTVDKKDKFVCADNKQGCFNWKPEMITDSHYCLISRAETADHPSVIPAVEDVRNFAEFICNNRSYGWRNVTVVDRNTADYSQTVHYKHGKETETVHVILSCKNLPIGTEVGFDCPAANANPPIHMPRTKITNDNQDIGIVTEIQANMEGDITYYFWTNGVVPTKEFSIDLHCVIFVPSDDPLAKYAKSYEELGFSFSDEMCQKMRIGKNIGPEKGIILGQYSVQGK